MGEREERPETIWAGTITTARGVRSETMNWWTHLPAVARSMQDQGLALTKYRRIPDAGIGGVEGDAGAGGRRL